MRPDDGTILIVMVWSPVSRVCRSSACLFAGELQPIGRFGVRSNTADAKDGFASLCLVCERRRAFVRGRTGSYDRTPGRVRPARQVHVTARGRAMACVRCGEWLPADDDHFVKDRTKPDGLQACCLLCRREAARARRARSGEPAAGMRKTGHGRANRTRAPW